MPLRTRLAQRPDCKRKLTPGAVGCAGRRAHHADPDPPGAGDDYLIALAAQERAALVSGDRHLLELAAELPIYAPADFLSVLDR